MTHSARYNQLMRPEAQRVLDQLNELSDDDREAVLVAAWNRLHPDDPVNSDEWADEIVRRVRAIESGESKLRAWSDVEAELRASIKNG